MREIREELKGTISDVMRFCRSIAPGQILALGVSIVDDSDKILHIVYRCSGDTSDKTEKESVSNEVRAKLDRRFGYASHWSKIKELEMLGLDEQVKGICRKVIAEILGEIGEKFSELLPSPRRIQLVFPLETKIRTESQERGKTIHVVKTNLVYYTAGRHVIYAWNVPSVDKNMKGTIDGTVFATHPDWANGSVYKVHTFEGREIVEMFVTATEDGKVVIFVEFADKSRSTFVVCNEKDGKLKLTHAPTVVKPAVKPRKRDQGSQTPAYVN